MTVPPAPQEHLALHAARLQEEATRGHQARLQRELSDTEPDEDAAPFGSGPRGHGDALLVGSHERERVVCDGAGLCSLGQWAPWQRPAPHNPRLQEASRLIDDYVDNMADQHGFSAEELFGKMAQGAVESHPLLGSAWEVLVERFQGILDGGTGSTHPRADDQPQRLRVRLLQTLLALGGDPDVPGMDHFGRGVRVGVGVRLPRTPAVYARKRRWRLKQDEVGQIDDGELAGVDSWRLNYRTAIIHKEEVHRQLMDHHARGMAVRLSPAEALTCKNLSVNSLGGVEKPREDGQPPGVRVVMDATHGVLVNRLARQRDQDRCPTAFDVKRVQRAQSQSGPLVGLAVDAQDAHRLVAVHPDDWALQGCRSDLTGEVFLYKVGCFGITTAAYWWSRLGGALVRALHLVLHPRDEIWALLMADDFKLESSGRRPARAVVKSIILLLILGLPIAWPKIQGGTRIAWIGYEIWLDRLAVGISARRAAWCTNFLNKLARDGRCDLGYLRSGIGRLTFVVTALEWERPFLAPYYSFLALHAGRGHRALPLYIRLISRYLSERIGLRRVYPSATKRPLHIDAFRVDAHAEGHVIGIGGWLPRRDSDGALQTWLSPWFSFQLDYAAAPWAYARGEPYRSIAALEAVGVLVALLAFKDHLAAGSDSVYTVRGLTDNRGNRSTVSRLRSSKFPLCAVLMEVAAQSESLGVRLALDWIPRDWNQEADALSNGVLAGFDPKKRVEIEWARVPWLVLHWAMEEGRRSLGSRALNRAESHKLAQKSGGPKETFRTKEQW